MGSRRVWSAALVVVTLALAACGGGTDVQPLSPPPTSPPPGQPPANRAPTISMPATVEVVAGNLLEITPTASDPDGQALTFTVASNPAWLSLDPASGKLSGTPASADVGTYQGVRVTASDGAASASAQVDITVRAAPPPGGGNQPPTISLPASVDVIAGTPLDLMPTASDPEGQTLTFSITNKPAWVSFNTTSGRLTGTPAGTDVGTFAGVRVTVSDGSASASAQVDIRVTSAPPPANRAPTISGAPATTATEGQAYSFRPTASDPDGDTLSYTISGRPSWASFNTSTGRLSGTPAIGTAGDYANIVITVSDGTLTASLPAFSIRVQQVATGSATLTWQPPTTRTDDSPLTNLAGFRIRYGTSQGSYPNVITLDNPGLTTYVVENLTPATYHFVMSAFDEAGLESANTNSVSKTIGN